ncbi:beta-glucosidase [Janthinobacterium sp. J1-1]|uniref:beta-glucosidase n=1 Tax=unclassified Janthinobacterium TaxID=2610881 RepID=UPI0028118138|nr:glycoside hydrolase family 3 C-terminal domain-containing protein [Janthinobacterium sp. J1-1]
MKQTMLSCMVAAACATLITGCGSSETTPAGDTTASADTRASQLVAAMTLDEKIQLVHGTGIGVGPLGGAGYIPGIARLGIADYYAADSSTGVSQLKLNGNALTAVDNGATPLPSGIALAASWDTALAREYGAHIAKELRTLGYTEGLGGGVNLARELRNGRTFEYSGEDPVLAGNMIVARTLGTQSEKVVATIKHYVANDQETNRFTSNSIVDERSLRELHMLPFEIGVKEGQPGNVMCAYNLVNGDKSCESKYLLTDVLKNEWGFRGKVQSDWFQAITDTVKSVNAGLDEEQAGSVDDDVGFFGVKSHLNQKLKAAVQAGTVSMARLDDMVKRRLRTVISLGIHDSPATPAGKIDQALGDSVARKVAEQSMVLLKNDTPAAASAPALPLDAAAINSIVVIGGHADVAVLSGGGAAGTPPRDGNAVACLDPNGMIGGQVTACAVWYKSSPLDAIRAKAPRAVVTYLDGSDRAAAAQAAANADVAIVFATQWQTEAGDLPSLSLPDAVTDRANQAYDQNALIAAVAARAKRSIVVLENGTAVTMPWIASTHAVLAAWYPGVKGGQAIANVLFGDVNPSAKLPVTFPKSDADVPQKTISATDNDVRYSEGLLVGYRWYDAHNIEPLFPFGHGLSYTRFAYTGASSSVDAAGNLTVSFTLANTGKVAGAEVAQVYATLPAAAGEPPQRLVGWQKVTLAPGESKIVSVTAKAERLAIWDVAAKQWRLPDGKFTLAIGGSSRDKQAAGSSVELRGRLLPLSR